MPGRCRPRWRACASGWAAGVGGHRGRVRRCAAPAARAVAGRGRGPDQVREVHAGQRVDRATGGADGGGRVHPTGDPVLLRHGGPRRGDPHRRQPAGAAVRRRRHDPGRSGRST